MISISTLFDPRYVFLVYAPILFALNKRVGHRMIIALTLTEWSNQILKWLLAGERPYWYVHERALQLALVNNNTEGGGEVADPQLAQLKQFPVTCELGAGSPSGHAMVTATVWYILIDAYLKGELPLLAHANNAASLASGYHGKLAKLSWSLYATALVLVSLSRVYLACHFPHQCLCGGILGVAVARLVVERLPMERLRRSHFCLATAFMLTTALGTYAFLRSLGMNPLWSVDKGMRWCINPAYIHLDTTPFASMTRYLGVCLGAGLAYNSKSLVADSPRGGKSESSHLLLGRRSLAALLSIGFGQLLLALPVSRSNLNVFYVISFFIYVAFSYTIATRIPSFAKQVFSLASRQDSMAKAQKQN